MENLYKLPVLETISTSWAKVKGTKGSIWAVYLIMIAISFCAWIIGYQFIKPLSPTTNSFLQSIIRIINFLLEMGLFYIGIQRAFDLPVYYEQAFRCLRPRLAIRIIALYILQIIIFIPLVFLVIFPSIIFFSVIQFTSHALWLNLLGFFCVAIGFMAIIFFIIRLSMALAFVLDKGVGPFRALSLSFRATRGNFWNLVGIFILQMIIFTLGLIPLGIGLIWTIPFGLILYGMVYKRLLVNITGPI